MTIIGICLSISSSQRPTAVVATHRITTTGDRRVTTTGDARIIRG